LCTDGLARDFIGSNYFYTDNFKHSKIETALIEHLFRNRQSDTQVSGDGTVLQLLRDDTIGSQHQRFIIELKSGHTILVAHNIDIAPKVLHLKNGDNIGFSGEYEWTPQGGVLHWTHKDPDDIHPSGYLRHNDTVYQ
tara:strand:- start:483 stop:893 length:411 start_codon:yes stop_codon:yes gene_type:complete